MGEGPLSSESRGGQAFCKMAELLGQVTFAGLMALLAAR